MKFDGIVTAVAAGSVFSADGKPIHWEVTVAAPDFSFTFTTSRPPRPAQRFTITVEPVNFRDMNTDRQVVTE